MAENPNWIQTSDSRKLEEKIFQNMMTQDRF